MGDYVREKFESRAFFNESLKELLKEVESEKLDELSLSDEELQSFATKQATIILKNLYSIPLPSKDIK